MSEDSKLKADGTRVDLGEDLLNEPIEGQPISQEQIPVIEGIEEELQKAQILVNEKLFSDAKRILWKVLRKEPENPVAVNLQKEIESSEIQELMADGGPRKRLGASAEEVAEDPSVVLSRLETELRMDLSGSEGKAVQGLFGDEKSLDAYTRKTLKAIEALDPRERIDVGVAHLELGMYAVATEIFEGVAAVDAYRIEAMYLLGVALIHGGKAIEATIRLEPLARDLKLSETQKADFLYLMGLAFERLSDRQKAKEFYRRVHKLNPRYRDVMEKLN